MPDYMTVCEQAARAAGATLLDWVGKFSVREKGLADLVTEADVASQDTIRRIVLAAFPDHSLLGEEDSPRKRAEADEREYRWVADPLDGTTNYVHGIPHFAVSLALERNGVPLVGAIFDPMLDECFCAAAGGGAYRQRQPHPRQPGGRPGRGGRVRRPAAGREAGFARPAGLHRGGRAVSGGAADRLGGVELLLSGRRAVRRLMEFFDEDLGRGRRIFVGARGGRDRDRPRRRPLCPGKGPVRRRGNALAPPPVARTHRPDGGRGPLSLRERVKKSALPSLKP